MNTPAAILLRLAAACIINASVALYVLAAYMRGLDPLPVGAVLALVLAACVLPPMREVQAIIKEIEDHIQRQRC